ncbi:Flp family type IVb pilin [Altererythrobacter sp. KTW20L]|uniref:Flp family type IVb pilin n=1 Tax=Altererythrobacter sp. KTW20L TaxID=2942210 RepID=UPI0020C11C33|nr:Flp family type IVb pilin [Altererythrobacter sp. KTW20L]MCL6252067.1 Flp family type IVb pilin [Altererythrobacter sp. KTW20L]
MPARFIASLAADRSGATAIEYALIASLIAVAAVGGFVTLGNQVGTTFTDVEAAISEAIA